MWNSYNCVGGNGTDEYKFSALPGGYGGSGGSFDGVGYGGYWWSANENINSDDAYHRDMNYRNTYVYWYDFKSLLFSVRCVQDGEEKSSSSVPSSSSSVPSSSSFVHSGKGNNIGNYRTVKIDDQTWMAENLDYVVEGSKCYGEGGEVYDSENNVRIILSETEVRANCVKYGILYDWSTAMALPSSCTSTSCSSQIQSPHRGICPSGWHIPSDAEWDVLVTFAGGSSTAGTKLKAASGWGSSNGTDEYGFSALPGGYGSSAGSFVNFGINGLWWSATEYDALNNWHWYMSNGGSYVGRDGGDKSSLLSVRCVQD